MLLSYLILAISVTFAPLTLGLPASSSAVDGASEPGTLLGRHYLIQDRRQAALPTSYVDGIDSRTQSTNVPRRLVPYAKYLADRSDESWVRVRQRRADDPDANVNYLSNVGTYAPPRPPAPPIPGPPPTPTFVVTPPPNVTPPPVVNAPSSVGDTAGTATGKEPKRKHPSKISKEKGKKKMVKTKKVVKTG
ncbi:hypothetical protein PYCCODRAFT_443424 [Trametes coccinea BRFM310]|uniref:Uncharacterized protein n=1 Tax=Trametes coccinea (strain BRFM310) TaxID=1353009 RepID=A0A1Y2ILZ6_TRAC3|nr:hypothetical protein PYCCODRAFT_443424 [Trametes coccinea BRFM310]